MYAGERWRRQPCARLLHPLRKFELGQPSKLRERDHAILGCESVRDRQQRSACHHGGAPIWHAEVHSPSVCMIADWSIYQHRRAARVSLISSISVDRSLCRLRDPQTGCKFWDQQAVLTQIFVSLYSP